MLRTSLRLLPWFLGAALCGADRYQASEPHMGTLATITLYADSPDHAREGFVAAFRRIGELDSILSDYRPDSELSRVCDIRGPLSRDLMTVLKRAQRLSQETSGAFDITVGPLSRLWREARLKKRLPDAAAISQALSRSGYTRLQIDEAGRNVNCSTDGMRLDAGGIAKGYAADEALAMLRRAGIRSALVALSGDIAVGDPPPDKPGWRIKVQTETLLISNVGVSTSGDEFQFLEIDGHRYSHIIDPRSGAALRDAPVVSVIAETATEADSLATALNVLGRGARSDFESRWNVRVLTN